MLQKDHKAEGHERPPGKEARAGTPRGPVVGAEEGERPRDDSRSDVAVDFEAPPPTRPRGIR